MWQTIHVLQFGLRDPLLPPQTQVSVDQISWWQITAHKDLEV